MKTQAHDYCHIDPSKPLTIIVDTSVLAHKLHQNIPHEHNDPQYESIIKANLVWLISGAWLGHELRSIYANIIFVKDIKTYWRSEWLLDMHNVVDIPRKTKAKQKLVVEYKSLIATPDADKTDEDFDRITELTDKLNIKYKAGRSLPIYKFTKTRKLLYRYLSLVSANVLEEKGYEADDWAAAIVKTNTDKGSPDNLIILTVDTDWQGLVNPSTTWVCMSGFNPVVRDSLEVCNQWTEKRLKCTLETWRDIWDVKGDKGDASDNLPPSDGILLPVIDLLEPPIEHRLWLKYPKRIQEAMTPTTPRFNLEDAKRACTQLKWNGLQPVVKMLPGETLEPMDFGDESVDDMANMLKEMATDNYF